MNQIRLFAATGDAVARIDGPDGERFEVALSLEGSGAQCLAVDPDDPNRVYAGTFDQGVYRSRDGGETWQQVGDAIPHKRVLSVAFAPARRSGGQAAVYAGTEPSNLYRSEDDGLTWETFPRLPELPSAPTWSFPPRPWTSHVRWIAAHPVDADTIYVGIELGGVMCSRDGGATWEDRKPGSQHDSHALATHLAAPDRVYEAAGGGIAISEDAGVTWRPIDAGTDRHYSWGLAVDAADPDLWYVSASYGAHTAHRNNGNAQAVLYRKRGDAPWQPLDGGGTLSSPLPYMPYALVAPRDRPMELIAGLQNGDLLLTEDAGQTWRTVNTGLDSLLALSESAI